MVKYAVFRPIALKRMIFAVSANEFAYHPPPGKMLWFTVEINIRHTLVNNSL